MKLKNKKSARYIFLPVLTAGIAILVLLTPVLSTAAADSPNYRIDSRVNSYEIGYFKEDGIWYCISRRPEKHKNGEVYASGTTGGIRKAVIPALVKHDGKKYDVAGVNDWGFYDDQELESVTIEEGVKILGKAAFSHCNNLKKVKLADSINEAGIETFEQCGLLEEANIPDSLKEIPKKMFYECIR
ncbi:MAG: leucine-rich repeat domain-containing protein [Lachnospiraceae bacterium]|nr:leucine-rich repeat domain-containing protein [Lachnospiraceae bacterium]